MEYVRAVAPQCKSPTTPLGAGVGCAKRAWTPTQGELRWKNIVKVEGPGVAQNYYFKVHAKRTVKLSGRISQPSM